MNKRIKNCLIELCKKEKASPPIFDNPEDMLDILQSCENISKEEISQHHLWNEYRYIVKINNLFIRYVHAEANRDESVQELGYEFDINSICEIRPIEKSIIIYERVIDNL